MPRPELDPFASIPNPRTASPGTAGFLSRAMSIVEALMTRRRCLSLSSLAKATGLPLSTVHRILGELSALELVRATPLGYAVGARGAVWAQTFSAPLSPSVHHSVFAHLLRLHQGTGMPVTFGALIFDQAVAVGTVFGHGQAEIARFTGEAMPLLDTAIGQIVIASYPEIGDVLIGQISEQGNSIQQILAAGSASLPHNRVSGAFEHAVAVPAGRRNPVAALAVTGFDSEVSLVLKDKLSRAAYACSREIAQGAYRPCR